MKEIFERFSDCFVKGKRLYGQMQWQRYDSKGEQNLTCRQRLVRVTRALCSLSCVLAKYYRRSPVDYERDRTGREKRITIISGTFESHPGSLSWDKPQSDPFCAGIGPSRK